MTSRHFIVPGLLAAVLAVACDDAPPPLPPAAPTTPVAVAPAALPDPMAAQGVADGGTGEATAYVYAYAPVGKRDPFRSPFVDKIGPGTTANPTCNEGPLSNWDLDQLKLVATVTSDSNPLGMVEDPAGKGHVVRRNSLLGKLCGKVTEVLRECITVTEYYPTPDGKRVPNPKKMCLTAAVGGEAVQDLGTGKTFEPGKNDNK